MDLLRVKSSDFDDLKNSKKLLDSLILLHHSVNKYCVGQSDTENIRNLDNVYSSKRSCAVQLECLVSLAINRLSTHLITKTDLDSSSHEYWLDSVLFSNSTYAQENVENAREEFCKSIILKTGIGHEWILWSRDNRPKRGATYRLLRKSEKELCLRIEALSIAAMLKHSPDEVFMYAQEQAELVEQNEASDEDLTKSHAKLADVWSAAWSVVRWAKHMDRLHRNGLYTV